MNHPQMTPRTNSVLRRHVGDQVHFVLSANDVPKEARAFLRTNLGRSAYQRRAVIDTVEGRPAQPQRAWHSLPMERQQEQWVSTLTLLECGSYTAKAYLELPDGSRVWPEGDNVAIIVHPADYRSANSIYCAFTRMFGQSKRGIARDPILQDVMRGFDQHDFAVIPPSGTLRDLTRTIPHIVDDLGCRIVHLLPINPSPTTFARYGRYGSPYAALDFTAIDPALIEHDRRSTPTEQFRELVDTIHRKDARLFIDLAINHTGWGSKLQNEHPEWFKRADEDPGGFISPGAWGVIWEDLSELDYSHRELWQYIASCFLTWCQRGVDGFRCDAGYMIPRPAWEYIIAKVQQCFPDTIFLLEGLGGAWEITEDLLTTGGMHWAYSELFQNYDAQAINSYLSYCLPQSRRRGLWVHYAETHDNSRLAASGKAWALFRTRLCALCSVDGAYGYTGGVEWLATEKLEVHACTSMNWNADDHICHELATLTKTLANQPAFRDGAELHLLTSDSDPVVLIERIPNATGQRVLVAANPDREHGHTYRIPPEVASHLGCQIHDLTGQEVPDWQQDVDGSVQVHLPPLSCYALAASNTSPCDGTEYRRRRDVQAWAIRMLGAFCPPHLLPTEPWQDLVSLVDRDPLGYVAACMRVDTKRQLTLDHLKQHMERAGTPRLSQWLVRDADRILPLPQHHCLAVRHPHPFTVHLQEATRVRAHRRSVATASGHIAAFTPRELTDATRIALHDCQDGRCVVGHLQQLDPDSLQPRTTPRDTSVLLTNGRGGMAYVPVLPHLITSKYHCLLGANLHPRVPSDRHVLAKRLRIWVSIDGFNAPLDDNALVDCRPGPPARWLWRVAASGGSWIDLHMEMDLLPDQNTVAIRFTHRPEQTPPRCALILRIDCEDRSFHAETDLSSRAAQNHFRKHTRSSGSGRGFFFKPAAERWLEVWCDHGHYHEGEEISRNIPHPHELTRGQRGSGDAWSPGYFELPLDDNPSMCLMLNAETLSPRTEEGQTILARRQHDQAITVQRSGTSDWFGQVLAIACRSYLVRRDNGFSVIAGYPWFLDWGRDTLICARGLLTAGMLDEVADILTVFGRFEADGTLPNCIFGDDASNRDTSDAPLWYGVVVEELAERDGGAIYARQFDEHGRTVTDVLAALAKGYLTGTPNGIRVDRSTSLVWSPSHFTWMDTNHPAGTPRMGYPIEIQALWIRLLAQLQRLHVPDPSDISWHSLEQLARVSLDELYWQEEAGYHGDCIHAPAGTSATAGICDNALRCNMLLAVALGVISGPRARASVTAARDWLIVPGAIRSLAPKPLQPPLRILNAKGHVLADPEHPYRGRYEGDEDSCRKPAYHNGTAWTWPFPSFCEAYLRAFEHDAEARQSARAYLASMADLLDAGCLGQIPELLDGNAPHQQRGCLAQAWGVTEALRVWRLLQ